MREIKFRAWVRRKKKMIGWDDIKFAIGSVFYDSSKGRYYDVMQYTGLKDKNGKEIYEGDILRYVTNDGKEHTIAIEQKLGWNCGCCFPVWGWEFGIYEGVGETSDYEVIGNIYEQPELLKNQENPELLEDQSETEEG